MVWPDVAGPSRSGLAQGSALHERAGRGPARVPGRPIARRRADGGGIDSVTQAAGARPAGLAFAAGPGFVRKFSTGHASRLAAHTTGGLAATKRARFRESKNARQ